MEAQVKITGVLSKNQLFSQRFPWFALALSQKEPRTLVRILHEVHAGTGLTPFMLKNTQSAVLDKKILVVPKCFVHCVNAFCMQHEPCILDVRLFTARTSTLPEIEAVWLARKITKRDSIPKSRVLC